MFGPIVNPDKYLLRVHHRVTAVGLTPLPEKVSAIQNFPQPWNVGKLMRLNGMVNFYCCFMPLTSLIMTPLFATVAGKKGMELVKWDKLT